MIYANLIRAVLDGKKIQWRVARPRESSGWKTYEDPSLTIRVLARELDGYEYRVEPVPDIVDYSLARCGRGTSLQEAVKLLFKQEGSIIKRTFDGETKKLKSIEIVENVK